MLTHKMDRYHWNILRLCEINWIKKLGSDVRHKVYFNKEQDRHEYGVGFLVHKDMVSAVLGCRPVADQSPAEKSQSDLSVTIIQVYAH